MLRRRSLQFPDRTSGKVRLAPGWRIEDGATPATIRSRSAKNPLMPAPRRKAGQAHPRRKAIILSGRFPFLSLTHILFTVYYACVCYMAILPAYGATSRQSPHSRPPPPYPLSQWCPAVFPFPVTQSVRSACSPPEFPWTPYPDAASSAAASPCRQR